VVWAEVKVAVAGGVEVVLVCHLQLLSHYWVGIIYTGLPNVFPVYKVRIISQFTI
jgi:hypothetical protein